MRLTIYFFSTAPQFPQGGAKNTDPKLFSSEPLADTFEPRACFGSFPDLLKVDAGLNWDSELN